MIGEAPRTGAITRCSNGGCSYRRTVWSGLGKEKARRRGRRRRGRSSIRNVISAPEMCAQTGSAIRATTARTRSKTISPALLPGTPDEAYENGLLTARSERGCCRVLCFSPRHDLDVARMSSLK